MKLQLDENKPIFMQIKEYLEDAIINGTIKPGERVPSTNEFSKYHQINPATAAKGTNELVDEGILVKRRGVGMFVTEDAEAILIDKRRQTFYEHYVLPLKDEAAKLKINKRELLEMVSKGEIDDED
ncbi:GntR family transcriptional regulator [Lentibacillus salicampi]|uniref:GntR family transcriptional regulator n=1 Tax=Lentibacillus salicampi TaxID=175306 RepID=A0A4Y9A6Z8_9BACI|nr:GntR family transcriptional regulator [Lentibacillus salicampi]TFJ91489.1 GntR family transcriptional regulator [Lentibacillus salicampi]